VCPVGRYGGSVYRTMEPIKLLPDHWETSRLTVGDGRMLDLPELQAAYQACAYIESWTGLSSESGDPIRSALVDGDLPPGGSKEFFRLQSVRSKETGRLVGFLEMYHGYPTAEVFWVGLLVIPPEFQKNGYGRELTDGLKEMLRNLGGYRVIRLGVALKNWPAIRFWVQVGFDRIITVNGDDLYSDKTFAFLVLESSLAARSDMHP
jgi:diamine N-acetyltransferase